MHMFAYFAKRNSIRIKWKQLETVAYRKWVGMEKRVRNGRGASLRTSFNIKFHFLWTLSMERARKHCKILSVHHYYQLNQTAPTFTHCILDSPFSAVRTQFSKTSLYLFIYTLQYTAQFQNHYTCTPSDNKLMAWSSRYLCFKKKSWNIYHSVTTTRMLCSKLLQQFFSLCGHATALQCSLVVFYGQAFRLPTILCWVHWFLFTFTFRICFFFILF